MGGGKVLCSLLYKHHHQGDESGLEDWEEYGCPCQEGKQTPEKVGVGQGLSSRNPNGTCGCIQKLPADGSISEQEG